MGGGRFGLSSLGIFREPHEGAKDELLVHPQGRSPINTPEIPPLEFFSYDWNMSRKCTTKLVVTSINIPNYLILFAQFFMNGLQVLQRIFSRRIVLIKDATLFDVLANRERHSS